MPSTIKVIGDALQIPQVYMSSYAVKKISSIVNQCSTEVAWMGEVQLSYDEAGEILEEMTLIDVHVPKQEVGPVTCDISADGMAELAMTLMKEERDPRSLLWWGHSHVNMPTGPSGTDMDTFKEFIEDSAEGMPFIMSIHNKKGELTVNMYIGNGLYVADVSVGIWDSEAEEINANIKQELALNTTKEVNYGTRHNTTNRYTTPHVSSYYQSSYGGCGGNWVQPSPTASEAGNERDNLVGLRQCRTA